MKDHESKAESIQKLLNVRGNLNPQFVRI